MSNAMGGGGRGSDGFRHLLEHLGPATQSWLEDTRKHTFKWDLQDLNALSASVGKELEGKDVAELEKQRDHRLIGVFQLMKN